ncbi:hypothetical protein BDR26DRAFT_935211 [Obelidium mucronatum]|nr:hypothetical protein BDR26DRAFT_935211 [Obelidium mucronatum]
MTISRKDISPSEQTVLTYQATMYYGSADCSKSNVKTIDYRPFTTQTCAPWTCSATDFGQSSTMCLNTFSDALVDTTSSLFGSNVQYAQVKFWNGPGCSGMVRNIHYKLNECVVSTSKSDGSKSYFISYFTVNGIVSMTNKRYSDSECKNEILQASLAMDVVTRDCSAGPLWDTYRYSVDILTTAKRDAGNDSAMNVGAIVGGTIAGLFVAFAIGFALYRQRVKKGEVATTAHSNDNRANNTVEQIPLQHQSQYGSFRENVAGHPTSTTHSVSGVRDFSSSSSVSSQSVISQPQNIITRAVTETSAQPFRKPIEEKRHSMFDVMTTAGSSSSSSSHSTTVSAVADPFQDDRLHIMELKLPANPADWTIEEAARWISKFGGGVDYLEAMKEEEIDGRCLLVISEKQLFTVLKVTIIGRQAKLLDRLARLKALSATLNETAQTAPLGNAADWETLPPAYQTVHKSE